MTAKEFYQKCNEKTKKFFKVYFTYTCTMLLLSKDKNTSIMFNVYDIKSKKIITDPERAYFYFLYVLNKMNIDVGNIFKSSQNNIKDYYYFEDKMPNIIDQIIGQASNFTEEQLEEFFKVNLKCNLYIISALSDKDEITLEDAFDRLIKNGLLCYDNLIECFNINTGEEKKDKDSSKEEDILTYEEFYQRCTPDAEFFFKVYFNFIASLSGLPDIMLEVRNKNSDFILDSSEQKLFFFLMALRLVKNDIGTLLNSLGVKIEDNYKYYFALSNVNLAKIVKRFDSISDESHKEYYDSYFASKSTLKFDFHDMKKITIEQVLERLITQRLVFYKELMDNFKLGEIFNQIQGLALTKINGPQMSFKISSTTNSDELRKMVMESNDNSASDEVQEKEIFLGEELTKREFVENPLIGREREQRLMGAYLLDDKKSVIIHGKPGVGKTTLVESLAYQIKNGICNPLLKDKRIFMISAAEMVEGTQYRGTLEKKFLALIKKLMSIPNSILYIDEIHTIMGGGKSKDNPIDLSNMLKPYVGNGKIKIIGSTTTEELALIKANGATARRFKTLLIPELSLDAVLSILNRLIENMEQRRQIAFGFDESQKRKLLELFFEITASKYQGTEILYNPDFAISLLSDSYNLATYDQKSTIDLDYVIESVEVSESVNDDGKKYFKEEAFKRVREL